MAEETLYYLDQVPLLVPMVSALRLSHSWDYAEQATIEDIPRQQFIGPGGTSVQISARLHIMLGIKPSVAAQALRDLGDAGRVISLQTNLGQILGWCVLQSLEEEWTWTLPTGEVLASTLQLSLKPERAPEQSQQRSAPTAVDGSVVGEEVEPARPDVSGDPADVPLSEIVRVA